MRLVTSTIFSIIVGWWCSVRRVTIGAVTVLMIWLSDHRHGGGRSRSRSLPGLPVNVFDPAEYLDGDTDIRIRVEVIPHAHDKDHPIRLVLLDGLDNRLTELKFTPTRATDSANSIAKLLAEFIPRIDSDTLAEGLRVAAIKVWATRN